MMNEIISRIVRTFKEIDGKAKPEKQCRNSIQTLRGDIQEEIEIGMRRYDEMLCKIKDHIRQKKENMAKFRLKRARYKRLILRKLMIFHQVLFKVERQLTLDYFVSNITQLFTNIISSDIDAQTGLSTFQDLYAELSDMSDRFEKDIDEKIDKAKEYFIRKKESYSKAEVELLKIQIKTFIKIEDYKFVFEKAKVQQETHLTTNIMNLFAYMIKLNQHADIKLSSIKKFMHEYANISESSSQKARSWYIASIFDKVEQKDINLILMEDYFPQRVAFYKKRAEFFKKAKAKQNRAYTLLEGLLNKFYYDVHLSCGVDRGS